MIHLALISFSLRRSERHELRDQRFPALQVWHRAAAIHSIDYESFPGFSVTSCENLHHGRPIARADEPPVEGRKFESSGQVRVWRFHYFYYVMI